MGWHVREGQLAREALRDQSSRRCFPVAVAHEFVKLASHDIFCRFVNFFYPKKVLVLKILIETILI
jgi:hypothetical protein